MVIRDLDLLAELARHRAVVVFLSITTLDAELCRTMEPRTSQPERRLAALRALAEAGVPCGVMVAPTIPGLTDHEVPKILAAAAAAGAASAGKTVLRLPGAVVDLFKQWLEQRSPERRRRVLEHIRTMRRGQRNDSAFGVRMRDKGPYADRIDAISMPPVVAPDSLSGPPNCPLRRSDAPASVTCLSTNALTRRDFHTRRTAQSVAVAPRAPTARLREGTHVRADPQTSSNPDPCRHRSGRLRHRHDCPGSGAGSPRL